MPVPSRRVKLPKVDKNKIERFTNKKIMTEEEEKRKDMNNAKGCAGIISFGIGCYAIYLFIHAMGWI